MSTREALIHDIEKLPEGVLEEVRSLIDGVMAKQKADNKKPFVHPSYPEGFFERTAGAFADEPLERPADLPFEKREEW